jgi:hypothetical protein
MKTGKAITLEESLWETIDSKRGLIPRSTYCEKLLLESIQEAKK